MYYILDGKTYGNKIDALIASQEKTGSAHSVEFVPHKKWDVYDWTEEPTDSWESILHEHALNLRSKYKYLRLWYSGGVDSQTILNTFIKGNIYIDEIVVTRDSPVDKFNSLENGEQNWVAIPFLKAHQQYLRKTKINILNIGSQDYYKYYNDEKFFIENNNLCDYQVPASVLLYSDLMPYHIKQQKNAANITGKEKPIIGLDRDGFYLYYIDTLNSWNLKYDRTFAGEALEDFYLEPKVQAKQCHMVKNFCKEKKGNYLRLLVEGKRLPLLATDAICRDPLYIPFSTGKHIGSNTIVCGEGFSVKPITNLHNKIVGGRTYKDIFRENLTIESNSNLLDIDQKRWESIEQIVKSKLGTYWFNNKNDIKDGIVGKVSKKHYIEYGSQWYREAVTSSGLTK